MKKILSLILSLSMITVLSACSDDETKSSTSSDETTQTVVEDTTAAEAVEDSGNNENAGGTAVLPEGVTFGQHLLEDFKKLTAENPDITAEEAAQKLSENEMILFSSMSMPAAEGALSGFTKDITGFESGAMFGPAMGSIAFIGYVFELADESAAASFAETLVASADPRWQICVEAEETVCEAVGNKVFFVMSPLSNQ